MSTRTLQRFTDLQSRLVLAAPRRPDRRSREAGMTTAEYAVGTIAAAAFAAVLIGIVRSPAVRSALTGIITTALGMGR